MCCLMLLWTPGRCDPSKCCASPATIASCAGVLCTIRAPVDVLCNCSSHTDFAQDPVEGEGLGYLRHCLHHLCQLQDRQL